MWRKSEGKDVALNGKISVVEFQQLARRIGKLESRIDWVFIGEKASGRLRRDISRNILKRILRPLQSKGHPGLVFEAEVAVVPTANLSALKIASTLLTQAMTVPTGSAVWIDEDGGHHVLWLKTLFPTRSGTFTDELLEELIDCNFEIGQLAFEALSGVHQGVLTPEQCVEHFLPSLREYLRNLPGSLQDSYRESISMRTVNF